VYDVGETGAQRVGLRRLEPKTRASEIDLQRHDPSADLVWDLPPAIKTGHQVANTMSGVCGAWCPDRDHDLYIPRPFEQPVQQLAADETRPAC